MEKIEIVGFSEKENLRNLLNQYLIEIAQFDDGVVFDKNGQPIYKWFDCYWNDCKRFPMYYFEDGELAGFALVRKIGSGKYEIAEFCILQNFRRNGNASKFAKKICDFFDGQMEFSTNLKNAPAVKFWEKFSKNFNRVEVFEQNGRRN